MILVPVLLTGAILGGMYAFGRETGRPADEDRPRVDVIPQDQIPQDLQRRMSDLLGGLAPQFRNGIAPQQLGNPSAWEQLAQVVNQALPGSPQAPELLAIGNMLRQLGATGTTPAPLPIPQPLPSLPIPVPPALQSQLNVVLGGLPPPFNGMIPSFPFPGQPTTGPLAPSVDPALLTQLAAQVEAALGTQRPEPNQLRAIAAQLVASRAQPPVRGVPMQRYAPRYARFLEAQQARVGALGSPYVSRGARGRRRSPWPYGGY